MSGRDFDPFGSLGPINPQDPTDPDAPVDPRAVELPRSSDAGQDPGAQGVGDLAPWKPPARPARSPFTPVPGAPEGRTARVYPAAGSVGAGEPSAPRPEAPAPGIVPEPVATPEPDLIFFPVPAAADAGASPEPTGFDAAMDGPAEPENEPNVAPDTASVPEAEPELAIGETVAPASAEAEPSADPEFEDAAEFLRSLTEELEIDPAGLDDPRWASDAVSDQAVDPVAESEAELEPEPPLVAPVALVVPVAAEPAPRSAVAAEPARAAVAPALAADAGAEPRAGDADTPPTQGARRWLPYAAAVVIPLLFGGAVWATSGGQTAATNPPAAQPSAEAAPAPTDEGPIRVLAMGDMLPHDSVNQNAVQADGSVNFSPFFDGIQPNLAGADAVFCNQEVPSAGVDFGISGYPTFNTYAEFSRDLRQGVGCNLVNLATNHSADKGPEGIAATRGQWEGLEALSVSGANRSAEEQSAIQYGEVRGVKTALVSFAEYSNASIDDVSLNFMGDDALVERLLTEARANAQLVLVSAHWGTEDSHEVNDAQRAFAQRVADLGADVVLGTGPHVLQPVEWVPRADGGQTLVWYSLGNMLNTQLGLDQRTGIIASFEVVPGADGGPATVANPAGVLTWMHYDWTPEEEAALQLDARHALSIQPLAASADLLARTTYGVSVEQIAEQSAAILGPLVALSPGV